MRYIALLLAVMLASPAFAASYGPYSDNNYIQFGNPKSANAVVIVHGGWDCLENDAEPFFLNLGNFLANRGAFVVSINYRLTPGGHPWPSQWQDVQTAIRYMRSKGYKRVTAIGTSAGAYNVAGVAFQAGAIVNRNTDPLGESALYAEYSSQADAYVLVSPFTDLTDPALWQGAVRLLTVGVSAPKGMPPTLAASRASPITYVNNSASPILLFSGISDTVVPYAHSERFVAQLTYQQVDFQFVPYQGGHVFGGITGADRLRYYQMISDCAHASSLSVCR